MGEMPSVKDSFVYREGAGFQRRALESVPTSAFLLLGTGCDRKRNGRGRFGYLHSTVFLHTSPGEIAVNMNWNSMYLGQEKNWRTLNRDGSFLLTPEE